MRPLFICVLLLWLRIPSYGQNLAPNPGFENTRQLLCEYTGLAQDFDSIIYDWTLPHTGTSDIYSDETDIFCVSNCESMSFGRMGRQKPRSGNKMAGFFAYSGTPGYREYLEVRLKCPLIRGKRYYVEMYVSHAEETQFSCDNIGVTFRDNLLKDYTIGGPLGFTPVVQSAGIVANDTGWVKISGEFTANSASEYLIIGNFSPNTSTNVIKDASKTIRMGYYYIDDVMVRPVSSNENSTIDTSVCSNQEILLEADLSCFIGWATAEQPDIILSTDPFLPVSPVSEATYYAYGLTDTITYNVKVSPVPSLQFGFDTLRLCKGETKRVDYRADNFTYLWQDGSTGPAINVSAPGIYWLQLENSCGTARDSFFAKENLCECFLYTPNAFTPGSDGLNDSFAPVIDCDPAYYQLCIYDRWGERLFMSHQIDQKWDGTYQNKPVPEGPYFWILAYADLSKKIRGFTSGTVTVLR